MRRITVNARHAADGYGRAIRTLRVYRGMEQEVLAKLSGYTAAAIGAWERGRALPSEAAKVDLAQTFQVSLDLLNWLARGEDPLASLTVTGEVSIPAKGKWELYRPEEVCVEVGIGVNTLYAFQRQGILTPQRRGKRLWYTRANIEAAREEKMRRDRMKGGRNSGWKAQAAVGD